MRFLLLVACATPRPSVTEDTTDSALTCEHPEACPGMECRCMNGETLRAAGCVDGGCVEDARVFCADYCVSRGGMAQAARNDAYACEDPRSRASCTTCREGKRQCVEEACADSGAALRACLETLDEARALPAQMVSIDWYGAGERCDVCDVQAKAYLDCAAVCHVGACEMRDVPLRP